MKIIKFEAENIKKLRVVEITPSGNIVQITGANGAGKSSILDAIWFALGGGDAIPSLPLRKGSKNGHVKLDLGEIIVTRRFTQQGSTELRVESKSGDRLKSPQQILDGLVGSLTFDPLAFSRMKPADQLVQLRKLVKLEVDIDALDRENEADYQRRTEINREAKSLASQADGIAFPESTPDQEIDSAELVKKLEQAATANAAVEKSKADKTAVESAIADFERTNKFHIEQAKRIYDEARVNAQEKRDRGKRVVEDAKAEAERLIARAAAEEGRLNAEADQLIRSEDLKSAHYTDQAATDAGRAKEKREQVAGWTHPEPVDTSELSRQIASAQTTNRFVQRKKDKAALVAKAAEAERKAKEITRAMEGREERKRVAIESAKMPIGGLSFGDGQVLYNGIPFDQASSAEQLRVSTAIAIAMNPKLRVIRIQDGSLLDEANMQALAEMAEKHDQQIWLERVTGSGKSAVVIEDGQVKEEK